MPNRQRSRAQRASLMRQRANLGSIDRPPAHPALPHHQVVLEHHDLNIHTLARPTPNNRRPTPSIGDRLVACPRAHSVAADALILASTRPDRNEIRAPTRSRATASARARCRQATRQPPPTRWRTAAAAPSPRDGATTADGGVVIGPHRHRRSGVRTPSKPAIQRPHNQPACPKPTLSAHPRPPGRGQPSRPPHKPTSVPHANPPRVSMCGLRTWLTVCSRQMLDRFWV
jgi:hypothetical protein